MPDAKPALTEHDKSMRELNRLSERFYDNGDVNYGETVDWAIDEISRLKRQLEAVVEAEPAPCPSCKTGPVVLQDAGRKTWSVGCQYVFFRPETEQGGCELKLSVIGQADRASAVNTWNDAVAMRTMG